MHSPLSPIINFYKIQQSVGFSSTIRCGFFTLLSKKSVQEHFWFHLPSSSIHHSEWGSRFPSSSWGLSPTGESGYSEGIKTQMIQILHQHTTPTASKPHFGGILLKVNEQQGLGFWVIPNSLYQQSTTSAKEGSTHGGIWGPGVHLSSSSTYAA